MTASACPFCHSTYVEVVYYNRPCVCCRNCGACGPDTKEVIGPGVIGSAFKAEAIELWNRRPGNGELLPKTAKLKTTKEASQWGLEMSDWFRSLLPEKMNLGASWKHQWAICFDALIDVDKRNEKDVIDVCMWARHDEFWSRQFFSPLKLRDRNKQKVLYFDVFLLAMKAARKPASKPTLGGVTAGAPTL